MPARILIVNGPNLNALGTREPEIYGHETLADIEAKCQKTAEKLGLALDFVQSNNEGEIVTHIQSAAKKHAGIIINGGAYTHTSIAIMDALLSLKIPVIEVHLSNIFRRESFRHESYISKAAKGVICGFGSQSYLLALDAMAELLKKMSPLKIGHRGASGHYPENTLLAFRRAIEQNADAVECDVHVCKSGEPIVIHDATLKRTTNGKGRVASHTLAQLKKLDAGRGERIPTLDEAIELVCGKGKIIFIEIKMEKAAKATLEAIERAAKKGIKYAQMPVISFRLKPLLFIKKHQPKILIGITPGEGRIPRGFIAKAKKMGMWSVNPNVDLLTKKLVDEAHEAGLKIITWTANTKAQIARAKTLGVGGIIGDFPELL